MVIYTVKNGDSLYSISQKYNFPISRIVRDNQLENLMWLPVGLSLVIMTDNVAYKVQSGDSLYKISREYGVTIDSILRANPSITNPFSIRAGQTINIPFETPNYGKISVNGYASIPISASALTPTLPYLTYMSSFSYQVSADGSLTPPNDDAAVTAAINVGAAPLMVITNILSGGSFDSDIAEAILTNEYIQDTLINNIIDVLEEKNFYGLDIDFEYIYPRNREDYNAFIFKISDILRPMGYSVSSAVAPKISGSQKGTLYEAHDYAAHGRALDFVTIMTYEWGYL